MSRSIALDPVCSRTTAIVQPPVAKNTNSAFDPLCRQVTGSQTVVPDVPTTG